MSEAPARNRLSRGGHVIPSSPDQLEEVAAAATVRLGREVNIRRIRSSAWHAEGEDPFRTTVLSRPTVPLIPARPGSETGKTSP